jgi:hypothetical protein
MGNSLIPGIGSDIGAQGELFRANVFGQKKSNPSGGLLRGYGLGFVVAASKKQLACQHE